MTKLDSLDKRLIELLQEDAHRSSEALAKKLRVSPATVRRRTRRLIKEDVMRIQAVLDYGKVGLSLPVLIALNIGHEDLNSVMRFLAKQPSIRWVASCTGRFDVMALARFGSSGELSDFLQKQLPGLKGVRNSETFVCLHVEKP